MRTREPWIIINFAGMNADVNTIADVAKSVDSTSEVEVYCLTDSGSLTLVDASVFNNTLHAALTIQLSDRTDYVIAIFKIVTTDDATYQAIQHQLDLLGFAMHRTDSPAT